MLDFKGFSLPLAIAVIPLVPCMSAAQQYSEAPGLADRVAAGDLPPIAERLPDTPEVVTPHESVGSYGGVIRRGIRGSNDHNNILRIVSPQGLTRWAPDWSSVVPNVAESWTENDDASEYTFKLRKGIKWSDGAPFTTDDIMFFVDDILNHPDFYGDAKPGQFVVGGQAMQAEKIDDFTVKLTFASGHGQFLKELATPLAQQPVLWAKHYCSQFHPAYNDEIETLVAAEGASDWVSLFKRKCGDLEIPARWGNPERPTLDPWIVTDEAYTGGATRVVMERNPYFWQVDTEGQQLPYIDEIIFGIEQDTESLILQVIAGEVDMQARHLSAAKNMPVFFENQEKGGYDFFRINTAGSSEMGIYFNITHPDNDLRAIFEQKDFRVAMSLGFDREELIDLVWEGQGEPWQAGEKRGEALFHERLSKQFTEYDPDRSNELLDSIGLDKRDDEGFRLLPNGERLAFQINVITALFPTHQDATEIIVDHWREELGIDVKSNPMERSIFFERMSANEHDVAIWTVPGGLGSTLDPRIVIAIHPQGSMHAIGWTEWYLTDGKSGMEPSESMKMRYDLFADFKASADPAEQLEIFTRIHDEAAEQFEVIGTVSGFDQFGIKNAKLMNVPDGMPGSWVYPHPGPTLPQQYYYGE